MKIFTLTLVLFFTLSDIIAAEPPVKTYKIVLTHMGSKKLIKDAYFYVGDEKVWTIDFRNGDKLRYTITGRVGSDPMCGLTSVDNFGDSCAICITKLSGDNLEVELRYLAGIVRYKGYITR